MEDRQDGRGEGLSGSNALRPQDESPAQMLYMSTAGLPYFGSRRCKSFNACCRRLSLVVQSATR